MPVLDAFTSNLPGAAPRTQRELRPDPALALLPEGGEAAEDPFLLYRPPDLVTPIGDYATLAAAIAAAQAGDRIVVQPGAPTGTGVDVTVNDLTIVADWVYYEYLTLIGEVRQLTVSGDALVFVTGSTGDDSIQVGDGGSVIGAGDGNDTVLGATALDEVNGGNGADLLVGMEGGDILWGGNGDDTLNGGAGKDYLSAGSGNDWLIGGADNDRLIGGGGNDSMYGGPGNDDLVAGEGDDYMDGGAGSDRISFVLTASDDLVVNLNRNGPQFISASQGTDTLVGIEMIVAGAHDDLLVGNAAGNAIYGESGNDTVYGLAGADQLYGSEGDDLVEGSGGDDTMSGGNGIDTLSYYHAAGGVTVNLELQGVAQDVGGLAGIDTLNGFENLYGSHYYADWLTGDAGANVLAGYNGYDTLVGHDGNDTLYGMRGNDTLDGGGGADLLVGGGGYDTFFFLSVSDSEPGSRDTIADFTSGFDLLHVGGIDADEIAPGGNQDFAFIGSAAFSGTPGELRFITNGADGFVLGDTDGDGVQELEIRLLGVTAMDAGDFIL